LIAFNQRCPPCSAETAFGKIIFPPSPGESILRQIIPARKKSSRLKTQYPDHENRCPFHPADWPEQVRARILWRTFYDPDTSPSCAAPIPEKAVSRFLLFLLLFLLFLLPRELLPVLLPPLLFLFLLLVQLLAFLLAQFPFSFQLLLILLPYDSCFVPPFLPALFLFLFQLPHVLLLQSLFLFLFLREVLPILLLLFLLPFPLLLQLLPLLPILFLLLLQLLLLLLLQFSFLFLLPVELLTLRFLLFPFRKLRLSLRLRIFLLFHSVLLLEDGTCNRDGSSRLRSCRMSAIIPQNPLSRAPTIGRAGFYHQVMP
jgi:hypothetical protein